MIIVHFWWWVQYHIGMTDGSGRPYLFWSGFAGDLIYIGALGGLLKVYRTRNCKVKGCFRIGHHPVEGTPYKTCHKHATRGFHKDLHRHHETKHPEQHKLFNKDKARRDSNGRFKRR